MGRHETYSKTDFSGDPAEQMRIIGFIEDCGARYNGNQILVQTSTTHPAQIRLFNDIFGKYGHVNRTPVYNKRDSKYQWQLQILLRNPSFEFLIEYKENPVKFLADKARDGYETVHIGSFTDAEGWVGIQFNKGHPRATVVIANNNRQLLEWTRKTLGGTIYPCNHGFQLVLRGEQAVYALRKLPITHEEKVPAKELILQCADNGGIGLEALTAYEELRRNIDEEVQLCTTQARLEFIRRHGRPHQYDPDQTMR